MALVDGLRLYMGIHILLTKFRKDFGLLRQSLTSFSAKVLKIPFPSRTGTNGAGKSPTRARETYAHELEAWLNILLSDESFCTHPSLISLMRPASVAKQVNVSQQVGTKFMGAFKSAGNVFVNGLDIVGNLLEGQSTTPLSSPLPPAKDELPMAGLVKVSTGSSQSSADITSLWAENPRRPSTGGIMLEMPGLEKEATFPIVKVSGDKSDRETDCGVAIPSRGSSLIPELEEATSRPESPVSTFDVELTSTELEIILECTFGAIEEVLLSN
jgi:hypothetical protein